MTPAKLKRMLLEILGLAPKGGSGRARDNVPEWIKQQALDRAKDKRAMRAEKLRAAEKAAKRRKVCGG